MDRGTDAEEGMNQKPFDDDLLPSSLLCSLRSFRSSLAIRCEAIVFERMVWRQEAFCVMFSRLRGVELHMIKSSHSV